MVPPTTSVFALMAKRPKPPPGSGFCPAQISASRSEAASAASVPSILTRRLDADRAVEGGLQRLAGEAQLQAGAVAGKRRREIAERDGGVERLAMPDEAAGGAEALGDRRPGQREVDVVERLGELVGVVAHHHGAVVDAHFGERRRPCAFGFWLRASASIRPDQLERPSGSRSTAMVGRSSDTSAISTCPSSSGKKRNRAVSRSAVSAGLLASPSTTSPKLTLP